MEEPPLWALVLLQILARMACRSEAALPALSATKLQSKSASKDTSALSLDRLLL
jgi:hypothetical protein